MINFLRIGAQSFKKIFTGKNLLWQGIMIGLTAILVTTNFDWWYFVVTRNTTLQTIGFSAGLFGFLIPVIVPLIMYAIAFVDKNKKLLSTANAVTQAGILGLAISSLYKVFTGRIGLPQSLIINTSHMFRFGFLEGGAFQGWPSSHTTVAFAMSIALVALYPKNKISYVAIVYALFIGIGASVAFHWFSDFASGIILGTVVGLTVARYNR